MSLKKSWSSATSWPVVTTFSITQTHTDPEGPVMREATYFHTLLISSCYTSGSCILSPCISHSSSSSSILPPTPSLWSCSPPFCREPLPIKGSMADSMQYVSQGCSGGLHTQKFKSSFSWMQRPFGLLTSLLLVVTHFQVRERGSWGQQRLRWGAGMGSGGVGGLAGKAGTAALIYVPADIKGLCTWLFPNHYRRTINYGRSLIAIFCKWKWDNKCMPGGTGMRLWRWGYKTVRANRSRYLGKRPLEHNPLLPFFFFFFFFGRRWG